MNGEQTLGPPLFEVLVLMGASVVGLTVAIVLAFRTGPHDAGRVKEGDRMRSRNWMLFVLLALALAGPALAQDVVSTPCTVEAAQVRLEVIGASFPTLPEPYVSLQTTGVSTVSCGGPHREGRTSSSQRLALTRQQARLMGRRLVAWSLNPQQTQTLFEVRYSGQPAPLGPGCEIDLVEIPPAGGGARAWVQALSTCEALPSWEVSPLPSGATILLSLQPRVVSPDGHGSFVELVQQSGGLFHVTATVPDGPTAALDVELTSGQSLVGR